MPKSNRCRSSDKNLRVKLGGPKNIPELRAHSEGDHIIIANHISTFSCEIRDKESPESSSII